MNTDIVYIDEPRYQTDGCRFSVCFFDSATTQGRTLHTNDVEVQESADHRYTVRVGGYRATVGRVRASVEPTHVREADAVVRYRVMTWFNRPTA